MCHQEMGDETHHKAHQKKASKMNSYIESFHKNHPANLMILCVKCHKQQHRSLYQSNKRK